MPEITLADLVKSSSVQPAPEVPSAAAEELNEQLDILTPEERRQADELKEQIDIRDSRCSCSTAPGPDRTSLNSPEIY